MPTIKDPVDIAFAEVLRRWCAIHDGRSPSGALVIPFFKDGLALQYVGTEDLTEKQLLERLQYVFDLLQRVPYEVSTE